MNSYIELVGLPGSGKTTVSKMLREDAKNSPFTIFDGPDAYGRCFIRRHGLSRFESLAMRLSSRQLRLFSRFAGWRSRMLHAFQTNHYDAHEVMCRFIPEYSDREGRQKWLTLKTLKMETYYQASQWFLEPDESLLLDEGFIHHTLSLFCPPEPTQAVSSEDIETYLHSVPVPDICIVLDAPIETCKQRTMSREDGRPGQYGHLPDSMFEQHYERAGKCLDDVILALEKVDTTIVEITTDGSLRGTEKDVQSVVRNHL